MAFPVLAPGLILPSPLCKGTAPPPAGSTVPHHPACSVLQAVNGEEGE